MAYKIVIRRNGKTHGEMGPYSSPQAANADANTIKIRLSGDADVVVQRVEVGGVKYVPRPPQSSGSAPSAPSASSYKPFGGSSSGYKPSSAMPYVPAAPRIAAGGVVVNDDGLILVREPLNHFDGYVWSLPKGGVDKGESDEQGALREVEEETGVRAEIVERIPGEWKSTSATNRYFLMKPVEVTGVLDDETQQIAFVTYDEAKELLSLTTNKRGRERDLAVLDAGYALWLARKHATKSNPGHAPRTAAFQRWFGASKVVDARGEPLVVYHGTPRSGFDVFRAPARRGIFFSDAPDVAWTYSQADTDAPVTRTSTNLRRGKPALYEVFLRITKPLVVDAMGSDWASVPVYGIPEAQRDAVVNAIYPYASALSTDDLVIAAKTLGYDGIILKNVVDNGNYTDYEGTSTIYVVFGPTQVKSANMNAGTFDPADPNMRRNSRHRTHRFA